MAKDRPRTPLSLSAEDHAQLVAWSKRPKAAQALARRSRLGGPSGGSAIWNSGLDGLVGESCPGTSRKLSDPGCGACTGSYYGINAWRCHALVDALPNDGFAQLTERKLRRSVHRSTGNWKTPSAASSSTTTVVKSPSSRTNR